MGGKTKNRILTGLFLLLIVFFIAFTISRFIPRHGTANNLSDLQKVYNQAGPTIAASYTNSVIQKFPFDGPIDWTLLFFKEPMVYLTGKVDTNGLHQFIINHPAIRFFWMGTSNEVEEGWPSPKLYPSSVWTNIVFHESWNVDGYEAGVNGSIDFQTRTVLIRSSGSDGPVNPNK